MNCVGGNIALLIGCGILVVGPYSLITTAVSADLGQHPSLRGIGKLFRLRYNDMYNSKWYLSKLIFHCNIIIQGNSKAFATVAGIIDGTGSIGAALGPFIAGALYGSEEGKDEGHNSQLDNVFYALMVSNVISILVSVNEY